MTKAPAAFGRDAAAAELRRIVDWWLERAPDYKHGGFVGEIDHRGKQVPAGKKSLAYALTFQADDKTLKDADVEKVRRRIVARLGQTVGAELRG
jgi:phenylalanyl-tRNA synthetase beta chain